VLSNTVVLPFQLFRFPHRLYATMLYFPSFSALLSWRRNAWWACAAGQFLPFGVNDSLVDVWRCRASPHPPLPPSSRAGTRLFFYLPSMPPLHHHANAAQNRC